ncbi:MAG: Kae1-associated kinase Bud32 [Sulfolobaceae archaeon]|nr:Kae1-associated kinase Bud32 [Sulfolobaceae archaeon]
MEIVKLIKKGAEAEVYEGYFLGMHAIFKQRKPKAYRDPTLDKKIIAERTIMEARLMYNALKAQVNTPAILYLDPSEGLLVLEYVEGKTLREKYNNFEDIKELSIEAGRIAGRLHKNGIAHGDLNPNNLIVNDEEGMFIIDFGLAKRSDDIEDFATDVHVFLRSLESAHYRIKDEAFKYFIEGYSQEFNKVQEILKGVQEIRMRGRYVEERRKSRTSNE